MSTLSLNLRFHFKIYCMCTFREISALAWGDKTDKDIHRHTSTCLVGRRLLGVLIINAPHPPPLHTPPPRHLPAPSSVSVSGGDVLLGAALSVCRLILNFSAAAVGFLSGRSGLKRARCLSLLSPSSSPSLRRSPPAHRCPFPSVRRSTLWLEVFPTELVHRSAVRPEGRRHEATLERKGDRGAKGINQSDFTGTRDDVQGEH